MSVVILWNFIKIGQTIAEIWRFNGFQNGGRPPSWICWARIRTTHDDYSVVSIVVQNLVDIDEVVSIVWNFQYFAGLAWKRLFSTPKLFYGGGNSPLKPGAISTKHPKGTPLREYASKFSENPNFGGVVAFSGFFKPNWRNIDSFILSKLLHRFQPNFAQR